MPFLTLPSSVKSKIMQLPFVYSSQVFSPKMLNKHLLMDLQFVLFCYPQRIESLLWAHKIKIENWSLPRITIKS